MRGKGVPKMGSIFVFFLLCVGFRVGSKIGSNLFYNFGDQFWIPIFGVLDFLGDFWDPSSAS